MAEQSPRWGALRWSLVGSLLGGVGAGAVSYNKGYRDGHNQEALVQCVDNGMQAQFRKDYPLTAADPRAEDEVLRQAYISGNFLQLGKGFTDDFLHTAKYKGINARLLVNFTCKDNPEMRWR